MTIQEPTARPLTARDPRLAPWRSFLLAHARVSRRLDEELRAEHDVSFAEYDALLTIAQSPGRRIRMGLLAERGPPQQERRHAAGRPVGQRRARRAQHLLHRCTRRRGGPDRSGLDPPARRVADTPARHQRALPRRRRADDLESLERAMTAVARQAGPGSRRARALRAGRPRLAGPERRRADRPSPAACTRARAGSPTRAGCRGSTRLGSRRRASWAITRSGFLLSS